MSTREKRAKVLTRGGKLSCRLHGEDHGARGEDKLECYGFWRGRESAADGKPSDPVETRLLSLAFCCMGQFANDPSYLKM